jgi:hypothetical protein
LGEAVNNETEQIKRAISGTFDTPADENAWNAGAAHGALQFMQQYEGTTQVELRWLKRCGAWQCLWIHGGNVYRGSDAEIHEATSKCMEAGLREL